MIDETSDNWVFGGIFLFGLVAAALLVICVRHDQDKNNECQANGGIYILTDGGSICIDKKSVIK